jgi:radical SAM superfamily enzyme YgiQ (UPF0313 family)
VASRDTPKSALNKYVGEFKPGLVCFTSVFSEYAFVSSLAMYVKNRYRNVYVLGGGPHISLNPETAIQDAFDVICIGEGEYPTLELAQQLEAGKEPSNISNLWIKHGADIERCPTRKFLQDLDSLPFPDRDMWQPWIADPRTAPSILPARGCPFNCTYCCNHKLKELADGTYVRFRSADSVLAELDHLISAYPHTRHVYFEVETLGANMNFAAELCEKLREFNSVRENRLTFGVNLRVTPNRDYFPLFSALRVAGFTELKIGLESGSKRIRMDILGRNYGNEDVLRTVQAAKRHGLKVGLYILLGCPGETPADFQETVECTRQCQPDSSMLSIFTPYPGSALYQRCEELGLLESMIDVNLERRQASLDLPDFPRQAIRREYILFPYRIYKGHKPFIAIAKKVLRQLISSSSTIQRVYRIVIRIPIIRRVPRLRQWRW